MSTDLNKITMIGRLTRGPELKTVGQSTVCEFSLANGRTFKSNGEKKEQTSFFNCVAWGKLGEIINQYCKKGKQIAIVGRLEQQRWEKDGQKKSTVKIIVEDMQMLGGRSEDNQNSGNPVQDAFQGEQVQDTWQTEKPDLPY